jgi:hypothetical protein
VFLRDSIARPRECSSPELHCIVVRCSQLLPLSYVMSLTTRSVGSIAVENNNAGVRVDMSLLSGWGDNKATILYW